MVFNRETIRELETLTPSPWEGVVYRHMFAEFPPERENTRGTRWNPPEIPAIYTSLSREVAIAGADYYISLQPIRPRARRRLYTIHLHLESVLDLSDETTLQRLALNADSLAAIEHTDCQRIGGAVEWLEHDGLLVSSARAAGINLVIYPNRKRPSYRFEVVAKEEL